MHCSQQPTNPKLGNAVGVLTKPRAGRPRISSFISGRSKRICIIQGSKTALGHKQLRIWSELEGDLPADTDKILNFAVANIPHIQSARNIFLNVISFVVICSCQLLVLTHSLTHTIRMFIHRIIMRDISWIQVMIYENSCVSFSVHPLLQNPPHKRLTPTSRCK